MDKPWNRASLGIGLIASVAAVGLETVACEFLLDHRQQDVVMVYLLGVVLLAVRFGYAASIPATVFSVAAFDFFFTTPYFSFGVQDKRLLLTFVLMGFVASVISSQTERIRLREVRTSKLYAMSRELTAARTTDAMASVAQKHLSEVFSGDAWIVLGDTSGELRYAGLQPSAPGLHAAVLAMATDALATGTSVRDAGREWGPLIVLRASAGVVGLLAMHPTMSERFAGHASRELLETFASQIALALERAKLADEAERAQIDVQRERLRNALLSSVSHDLKTPLAVIKGAVTALIEKGKQLPAARHREYLHTIFDETTRLDMVLRNLLAMTSLEAGALRARKAWHPLEEVIGVALNRLEEQLEMHRVRVHIAPEAALASCDATLLELVLINLVENATKYTPDHSPIHIRAWREADGVIVEVADSGPGVPQAQQEAIFMKFHRATTTAPGMGLGLTICRGIVTAHGGRIWYEKGSEGGAAFRFTLPADEEAPAMRELPEVTEGA
jgi:two-component system, OmpR family, sensor histidine kinase KdpD